MTANWYESLPKKRMGAGVLFFDDAGRLLIVKPTHKDHWSVPGGTVDANESPQAAAEREVKEELGLEVRTRFLCVDYVHATSEKSENLQFIFDGGVLTSEQIEQIRLDENELGEWRFAPVEEALLLLSEKLRRRIPRCLEAKTRGTGLYLENGKSTEVYDAGDRP